MRSQYTTNAKDEESHPYDGTGHIGGAKRLEGCNIGGVETESAEFQSATNEIAAYCGNLTFS